MSPRAVTFGLAAALACTTGAALCADKLPQVGAPMGQLEAFLMYTKNHSINEKPLGKSLNKDHAMFYALVAADQENPQLIAKGLRVELETHDGKKAERLYLDAEGIAPLLDSIAKFEKNFRTGGTTPEEQKIVGQFEVFPYLNRVPDANNRDGVVRTVLAVGWMKAAGKEGDLVKLQSARTNRTYEFPGMSLEELHEIFSAARDFLNSN